MTKKPVTTTTGKVTPQYITQLHNAARIEARVRVKLEELGWEFFMDEVTAPPGTTPDQATAILVQVWEEAAKEVSEDTHHG